MNYAVTLERGSDGTYLAWVDDVPGCAVRAGSKAEALEKLPRTITEFLKWAGELAPDEVEVEVVREVDSAIEAEEDTEVLVESDREALTEKDWSSVRESLNRSRDELLELLGRLGEADLARKRGGSERTLREEIEHIAYVELMYALWTFDLQSKEGLTDFLSWTRQVTQDRMDQLAEVGAADATWADWAGAPQPEPWTPRKAARRLLWHELLHLRALERFAGRP
jgi:predicted RNase H-like HicB family nuclease